MVFVFPFFCLQFPSHSLSSTKCIAVSVSILLNYSGEIGTIIRISGTDHLRLTMEHVLWKWVAQNLEECSEACLLKCHFIVYALLVHRLILDIRCLKFIPNFCTMHELKLLPKGWHHNSNTHSRKNICDGLLPVWWQVIYINVTCIMYDTSE